MKRSRKEKVYEILQKLTEELTEKIATDGINVSELIGFDAKQIGLALGIDRSNTSRELNFLTNESLAIKIKGKPVRYLHRESFETKLPVNLGDGIMADQEEFRELLQQADPLESPAEVEDVHLMPTNVFDNVIGAKTSLKNQIQQARAAIVYPPKGIHTLIVGPTGSGKTAFAEMMHRYAVEIGRFKEDAPFIIMNCADYADNPQLLLSHLYGHIKGAFTGAESNKEGLIQAANKGILCLDEIHRLPPEGQEMLFLLIDKGIYRKLGESRKVENADVLIIGITTEIPESTMLKTFLRRIPLVITLPSLNKWCIKERLELILDFFRQEALRMQTQVVVSKEVIRAFMLYECKGNIGQLKTDIQLICASAFLDYLTFKKKYVDVKLTHLSQKVQDGYFRIAENSGEVLSTFNSINYHDIIFSKDDGFHESSFKDNQYKEGEVYRFIGSQWSEFTGKGWKDKAIQEKIIDKVALFFNNDMSKSLIKGKINGSELNLIEEVKSLNVGDDLAEYLISLLAEVDGVEIETTADYKAASRYIGILVIAHGNHVATSMVDAANAFFDTDLAYGLDMPLGMESSQIIEEAVVKARIIDQGEGVLLMIDMDLAVDLATIIMEKTGISVEMVEMVNTPMLVDAIQQSLKQEMDLKKLAQSIRRSISINSNDWGLVYWSNQIPPRHLLGILHEILNETLTFLNPQKACAILYDVLVMILRDLEKDCDEELFVKFILHTACMVERAIISECLPHSNTKDEGKQHLLDIVVKRFEVVEEVFGVSIPESEKLYIVDLLSIYIDTH